MHCPANIIHRGWFGNWKLQWKVLSLKRCDRWCRKGKVSVRLSVALVGEKAAELVVQFGEDSAWIFCWEEQLASLNRIPWRCRRRRFAIQRKISLTFVDPWWRKPHCLLWISIYFTKYVNIFLLINFIDLLMVDESDIGLYLEGESSHLFWIEAYTRAVWQNTFVGRDLEKMCWNRYSFRRTTF